MPSIKRITEGIGIKLADIYGNDNVRPIVSAMKSIMKNAKTHKDVDLALDTFSDILHAHGVEAANGKYVDGYYREANLLYINFGDAYTPTIAYDTLEGEFLITSWGDFVEANSKRFEEQ